MERNFGPVFPIPPAYLQSFKLDFEALEKYVHYLSGQGVKTVMTTAGTSQFNLLGPDEILELNQKVYNSFPGRCILGAPTLSEYQIKPFLEESKKRCPNASFLIIYPERYYCDDDIISFFERVTNFIEGKFYFHGLPLKSGKGGLVSFSSELIKKVLQTCSKIAGMKEESSSYEEGFTLCHALSEYAEFEIIVAGGSMRRFSLLSNAGAQSFLTGVGSLFPEIEIKFYNRFTDGEIDNSREIIKEIETPFFEVFMKLGWQKSLRYALTSEGFYNSTQRLPMSLPNEDERKKIDGAINDARHKMSLLIKKGIL